MKKFIYLLSVLVILMAGCTRQDDNVIRIGAAGPMTGDQSKMGVDLRNSAELAVAEWNEKGGVLGKRSFCCLPMTRRTRSRLYPLRTSWSTRRPSRS